MRVVPRRGLMASSSSPSRIRQQLCAAAAPLLEYEYRHVAGDIRNEAARLRRRRELPVERGHPRLPDPQSRDK
jgi:hypothetical protein